MYNKNRKVKLDFEETKANLLIFLPCILYKNTILRL